MADRNVLITAIQADPDLPKNYAGEHVALHPARGVVAHHQDAAEVVRQAKGKGVARECYFTFFTPRSVGTGRSYAEIDLPKLPLEWCWEEDEMDGEPVAVRRLGGWMTRVYHVTPCIFSGDLAVSIQRYSCAEETRNAERYAHVVPFCVYKAVIEALTQFFGREPLYYGGVFHGEIEALLYDLGPEGP